MVIGCYHVKTSVLGTVKLHSLLGDIVLNGFECFTC